MATGTASELFGNKALDLDIFIRQVGLNRMGRQLAATIQKEDPELFLKMQSYCDGVNYYVSQSTFLPI